MPPLMVSVSGVRGTVGPDFHPLLVARWTAAFSRFLGPGPIVLGRDSRPSGALFASIASEVLGSLGRTVWELGIVPTPTVQVAVERWSAAGGLILTASHNPGDWNAMKFVGPSGSFLVGPEFERLRALADAGDPSGSFLAYPEWGAALARGAESLALHASLVRAGIDAAAIRAAAPRVLVECVHGAGGVLIPKLLEDLGARVETLRAEPTGKLPPHPEPSGEVLDLLAEEAGRRGVSFAIAVDPDADRCALAIPGTSIVGEEWTLPLVAAHLLTRRRGPVVTNLSTSTRLEAVAEAHGSRVERTPVGEANVVAGMRKAGAVLGGEGNGGVIDPEVHFGRDAAVAAAWLLEAEAKSANGLRGLASAIPERYVGKRKLDLAPEVSLETLAAAFEPVLGAAEDRRDGLRWSFPDGFVHLRASATEPIVRIVAESSTRERVETLMQALLEKVPSSDRG
ncbi:MAG: hypothetical protein ACE15D_11485 [Candidatus Eisenbacteria bacterium]